MRLRRPFARAVGSPLARLLLFGLRLTSRRVGLALIYHSIADPKEDPATTIAASYGTRLFEEQMKHLKACYRVVDSIDLVESARARRRGDPFPVAVTFDDDLAAHVDAALPILERVGVTATFFISGASLFRPFAFWWDRLEAALDRGIADVPSLARSRAWEGETPEPTLELAERIERMSPSERDEVAAELAERLGPDPEDAGLRADQVRALVDGRMRIGFHTLRHDVLPPLDDEALAAAMVRGREQLEDVVGQTLEAIAYPHGLANRRVADAARDAGFSYGFTGWGGPVRPGSDPLLLPRIGPYYRSVGQFALQLVLEIVSSRRVPTQ